MMFFAYAARWNSTSGQKLLLLLVLLLQIALSTICALAREKNDPYKVLDIPKTATQDEVKRAFRRLSIKVHPDRNPSPDAEAQFKELAEAYELLSNKEKRQAYDNYGWDGVENFANNDGQADPFDIFAQFFGMGRNSSNRNREKRKTPAVVFPLRVTLEQIYTGDVIGVMYKRPVVCPRADECTVNRQDCYAAGVKVSTRQMGPGFIVQSQVADPTCIETGKAWKKNCKACPRGFLEIETTKFEVFLEAGVRPETPLTYEGRGEQALSKTAGDLIFIVEYLRHPRFTRNENNILAELKISLIDSLVGFEHEFLHITGEKILVKRTQVSSEGFVLTIPNKGFVDVDTRQRGNLLLSLHIEVPKNLEFSNEAKQILIKGMNLDKNQKK